MPPHNPAGQPLLMVGRHRSGGWSAGLTPADRTTGINRAARFPSQLAAPLASAPPTVAATTATSAVPATATTAVSAPAAVFPRLGLIDCQRAALDLLAIERLDGGLGLLVT